MRFTIGDPPQAWTQTRYDQLAAIAKSLGQRCVIGHRTELGQACPILSRHDAQWLIQQGALEWHGGSVASLTDHGEAIVNHRGNPPRKAVP